MTERQARWMEFYFGEAVCNATEAARRAGYADPQVSGWQNKQKLADHPRFKQLRESVGMEQDEVRRRLAEQARSGLTPFINSFGHIDLETARREGKLHLLKKFKTGPKGDEIEAWDAQNALITIAKMLGMLKEQVEVSGSDGKPPIKVIVIHDAESASEPNVSAQVDDLDENGDGDAD